MPDHNHNSDLYGVSWGDLNMQKGLAKGSKIADSGITGGWTWKGDGQGGGVYSYDPDHSGTLTFNVEQANLLHQQLLDIWQNTDRSGRNAIADITVTNEDTQEQRVFHNCRIQRPPPFDLSTESPVVPWVFLYTGVTYKPNTDQNNVIGSGVSTALPPGP